MQIHIFENRRIVKSITMRIIYVLFYIMCILCNIALKISRKYMKIRTLGIIKI